MSEISLVDRIICAASAAWKDDGEVLATGIGIVPRLAASLCMLTHNRDLMMTDSEAWLMQEPVPVGPRGDYVMKRESWMGFARIFDNVWSAISILAWSDWLTLIILITFVVRGFIQGLAKEVISFIFVIIAIILAWLYYEPFAKTFLSSWINSDNQSTYALSFGGLFLSAWFIKKGLYRIASASASNQNSNDLNRPFANSVIFVIVGIFSFNFLGTVSDLKTIEAIITNESLRSFVSFVLIFVILMAGLFALSKLLNIKVDTENPSIMAPVYEGILSALSSLDTLINARNVDGLKNKFFGAILGLFIGGTFVLIVVLILQNMSWVTQNHAWVETSGALRTFQDWSVDVKPVLSKYLLFVELDPGDVVVEFIESEILKD